MRVTAKDLEQLPIGTETSFTDCENVESAATMAYMLPKKNPRMRDRLFSCKRDYLARVLTVKVTAVKKAKK